MAVVEELADEGDEITVEDTHRWSALDPKVGMVLEVHLGQTTLPVEAETWAAFLILATSNETDGSHTLTCRLLGCKDAEIQAALRGDQCAGDVALHLCLSRPCAPTREMEANTIHVTRARLWRWTIFKDTGYLPPDAGEVVKELLKADRGRRPKAAAKEKPVKGERAKGRSPKPPKPKTPPESGLTPAMKAALRDKLSSVRTKLKPGAKAAGSKKKEKEILEDLEPVEDIEEISEDREASSERLGTGTKLPTPKVATTPQAIGDRSDHKGKPKAISGVTSTSLSGQLVLRAAQKTQERKAMKKRKKSKKDKESTVVKLLSKILMGKTTSSGKTSSRKKKRRLVDGVIVSCSGSSSNTSESGEDEEEEEGSESDLEAPLRKKSRDKPGSVLAMLTDHICQQMDQSAMVEVGSSSKHLTGGVKVASYFQQQIKGQFPQYQRELRELHHLSATLDLLRMGDLGRVGDSLAARFMALHQFMIDANWGTAKFMELHSMEDNNAATPSVVLASRKHSRLVEKVQGRGWNYGGYGYYHRGKGRGKKGGKDYDDGYWDQKGEKGKLKGKGKKGKGKGQDGKWDNRVKEWDGAKASTDEK